MFSKEDKVSFLANKEWFRFKGFSQYVDILFSKGKEKDYDAYRRLPQNLRNQICTALFSSMLQEVEMYIKTRVLVYFHTIVQLDLDGWSRYSL